MAGSRGESRSRLRRGGEKEAMESAGMMRWLLTYADMITLLLALFIIMFAISTISAVKFNRLTRTLAGGFSGSDPINLPPDGGQSNAIKGHADQANMVAVKAQLDKYIAQQKLQNKVQTRIDKQGLVITLLSDKAYYDSGSADLRPETKKLLDVVAGQLRDVRNAVRVEGSTDDVPIATAAYPTNWELSAARATGVTRYLVERDKIVPTRLSFAGYGQFRPKFPNDNDAHRQQNRRVDIVILNGDTKPNADTDSESGPTAVAAPHPRGRAASTPNGRTLSAVTTSGRGPSAAAGTNGGGPSAAAPSAYRNAVARSDGGPHAPRGGRAAKGGAPVE